MLIVRGDAQTLPSELNKAATGEVWFDPILPKTDGVDVGTVVFSPNGRTVWHQHEHGQLLQITSGYGFVCKKARPHSGCAPATRSGSPPTSGTGTAPPRAR
jgi:quercetin dioxygenase-like cupin family protein